MRIQVHKCRVTGKIFEEKDREKYIAHLKAIREQQKELRLYNRIRAEFDGWLKVERSNILDVVEIIPWFIKNQQYIMDAANAIHFPKRGKYYDGFYSTDKFENIVLKLNYSSDVSNTHECPDNGVTNFCRNITKPTGYPGWVGYITGTLQRLPSHNSAYPYSKALNLVGIKTGSGGGGNKHWRYDVKLFLADWPGLGQSITVDRLKGIL